MADPRLASELSLFELLSKPVAAALGLFYLLGFLVVASYLSRYGVSSFAALQLQYLIAGIWALGPPVLFASLVHAERLFGERAAPDLKGRFNWRRVIISSAASGIPSSLLLILLAVIPNVSESMTWGMGIRLFLFCWTIVSCGELFGICWQADAKKESWWMNGSHAAPFYLSALLMIVLCYTVWFSVRIYPLIPFSLGGGKPLTVAFLEGEKKMPDEIEKVDRSSKRSIPYKLLIATHKSFVVMSPSGQHQSMEISRESVAGVVVL